VEPNRVLYEFGPFRVDPVERRLIRDGTAVPVSAKVFDTLVVFVCSKGRLLGKDALMRSIWPNTFVDEVNLAQSISQLRKALEERPGGPKFIETVPKHGYRFVADVREVPAASESLSPRPATPDPSPGHADTSARGWRGRHFVYTATVVCASVAVLTFAGGLRTGPISPREVTQLTNFTDSATAPVLSPDGKMLAFIRGREAFLSDGQIWAMMLPDGEAVQLTHESLPISTPAFSRDGSQIAYTLTDVRRISWDTWIVPVLGGPPRPLLSNATGLTWITGNRILFSEIKRGMHMGVVVSAETRSDIRDVYLPGHERAMAHYSYLSPDGRWVIVVEMDPTWRRCRLVPFDGSSSGLPVGPDGACRSAAWSPDGRWMYFGATVDGEAHLWRQRFPDGVPEQLTFGPTEEEGIAIAPDGRTLITSIGFKQAAIWIHGPDGDRPISSRGDASQPSFSTDGHRVYYLQRPQRSSPTNELRVTDRITGKSESLVDGFSIISYDVSPDEREVVFATKRRGNASELWVARLDGSAPPARVPGAGETPFFAPGGEIVYRGSDGSKNYLFTTGADRAGRRKVSESEISNIFSHSPDGVWAIALSPNVERKPEATMMAFPVRGGPPIRVCAGGCQTNWSSDGRFFQIAFHPSDLAERTVTFIIPLSPGKMLPPLPRSGFQSEAELAILPGIRRLEEAGMIRAVDAETYAYVKPIVHRNLYRLWVP
jgi:DNA-binding winged helix-turn-helix (wHTH) protein/Tol biopolymer transport system component